MTKQRCFWPPCIIAKWPFQKPTVINLQPQKQNPSPNPPSTHANHNRTKNHNLNPVAYAHGLSTESHQLPHHNPEHALFHNSTRKRAEYNLILSISNHPLLLFERVKVEGSWSGTIPVGCSQKVIAPKTLFAIRKVMSVCTRYLLSYSLRCCQGAGRWFVRHKLGVYQFQ